MSLEKFWHDIAQTATFHDFSVYIEDAAVVTPEAVELALSKNTTWAKVKLIRGYDAIDFVFLSANEQKRLDEAVRRFQQGLQHDPADMDSARDALKEIIILFEFHRFRDPKALQLGKHIEQRLEPERPAELAELRFQTGLDWSKEPALYIWAILNSSTENDYHDFLEDSWKLRKQLHEILDEMSMDCQPYLNFDSIHEREFGKVRS